MEDVAKSLGREARRKQLQQMAWQCFMAGFLISGEGYNGEFPFDFDLQKIAEDDGFKAEFALFWARVIGEEEM